MATPARRARREGDPPSIWERIATSIVGRAAGQFVASIIIWMAGGDC